MYYNKKDTAGVLFCGYFISVEAARLRSSR